MGKRTKAAGQKFAEKAKRVRARIARAAALAMKGWRPAKWGRCPNCGSKRIIAVASVTFLRLGWPPRQCTDCGHSFGQKTWGYFG